MKQADSGMVLHEHTDQPSWWRWMALLVPFTLAGYLWLEIYDLDVWWQVAIGRAILADASVPTLDKFTLLAAGRPYHDSHWLFQVLLAGGDRLAGMVGVQTIMVVLWGGTFWCCRQATRRWCPDPLLAGALLLVAFMAASERFLPRPEIVTILMIVFFYWRLAALDRPRRRDIIALAVAQMLWANSHGLFVIGPFLVGCYTLHASLRRPAGDERRAYWLLLATVCAATLATPFGLDGWRYALLLMREAGPTAPQLLANIGELSPTFGAASRHGLAFWFYAVLLVLLAAALLPAWRRGQLHPARLLIVAAMLALSLTGRRNMPLFALVAAPLLAECLAASGWQRPSALMRRLLAASLAMVGAGLLWFALSGSYMRYLELPTRIGPGATPSFFPARFPRFLASLSLRGQIFNSNTLGGFYLYHGYPPRLASSDGRWEIYRDGTFAELGAAMRTATTWQHFADRHAIEGLLLQHASPEARALLPLLRDNHDWRLIYCDAAASFWVRAELPGLPATLALADPVALAELPRRYEDFVLLDMFLREMPAAALRAWNLRQGLTVAPGDARLLTLLGEVELQRGNLREAEAAFTELLRVDRHNIRARGELAFFAFQRGDTAGAVRYLQEILARDPGNAEARANLRRIQGTRSRSVQ